MRKNISFHKYVKVTLLLQTLQEAQHTASRVASAVTDSARLMKGAPPTVQGSPSVKDS